MIRLDLRLVCYDGAVYETQAWMSDVLKAADAGFDMPEPTSPPTVALRWSREVARAAAARAFPQLDFETVGEVHVGSDDDVDPTPPVIQAG